MNKEKKKEDKPKNRLLTIENKLMVTRGEVGGGMGEIGEGDHDEHWVMYGSVESLYCTPETNITLYVNYTGIKTISHTDELKNTVKELSFLKKVASIVSFCLAFIIKRNIEKWLKVHITNSK